MHSSIIWSKEMPELCPIKFCTFCHIGISFYPMHTLPYTLWHKHFFLSYAHFVTLAFLSILPCPKPLIVQYYSSGHSIMSMFILTPVTGPWYFMYAQSRLWYFYHLARPLRSSSMLVSLPHAGRPSMNGNFRCSCIVIWVLFCRPRASHIFRYLKLLRTKQILRVSVCLNTDAAAIDLSIFVSLPLLLWSVLQSTVSPCFF